MSNNIYSFIREQRNTYETKTIPVPGLGDWNQYDHIEKTNAYWSDTYEEDDAFDDVIGAFPFDNIHKAPTLLEARSTDFDTKHIEVPPVNSSRRARISSMIATKALANHMEDIRFGQFMNRTSFIRAKFGGVHACKEAENIVVDKWEQLITDQADIMSAPTIKRVYMSPSEVMAMTAWKNTKEAIRGAETHRGQNIGTEASDDDADSTGHLIEVFITEGDFSVSFLKEAQALRDEDDYTYNEDEDFEYKYCRVICCGADWNAKNDNGESEENGLVFYAEAETMPLRKYLARNPLTGRGLGESVPEVLFEPQKWWNFTKTEEIRMIAIAGKKLYVTDDPDILANIFDEGVDHGTVLRVGQGKMLTELNQMPTGTPVYQGMRQEMKENARELTSYFQANSGAESKANVPFRAQYLQSVNGDATFQQYREELGFFYKEIIEDWVLPDALKKAASSDEIFATFTPQELQLIDEVIIESQILDAIFDASHMGKEVSPEMVDLMRQQMQGDMRREGSKRTITDIKEFIKDAGKFVRVHTTDEMRDKATIFESYYSLLQILGPGDPRFNAVVGKVMEGLNITKEELELYADETIQGEQGKPETKQLEASQEQGAQAAIAAL